MDHKHLKMVLLISDSFFVVVVVVVFFQSLELDTCPQRQADLDLFGKHWRRVCFEPVTDLRSVSRIKMLPSPHSLR